MIRHLFDKHKGGMSSKRNGFLKRFAPLLSFLVLVAIGCTKKVASPQTIDYDHLRQEVIQDVRGGRILPDEAGKAVLPKEMESVCTAKYIYISNDPTSGLSVIFLDATVDDNSHDQKGLLYCENGIGKAWEQQKVNIAGSFWHLIRPQDDHYCTVVRM